MGLLSTLVSLPVAGPVRGAVWLMERIVEEAENEAFGEESVHRALAQLSRARRSGEIDATEADALEAELMGRLALARRWESGRRGTTRK